MNNNNGGVLMKKNLSIEYCTSWGYLRRAVALSEKILDEHKLAIAELTIIPSGGGVFEITVDGKLLFSKTELGRFPEEGEAEEIIRNAI